MTRFQTAAMVMICQFSVAVATIWTAATAPTRSMVLYLIVDTNAESAVDVVLREKPLHANQHQVQIINRGGLHHPVHSTCHELSETENRAFISFFLNDRF